MFKHLRHLAKATLAPIILVTPLAAQATVDKSISNFTDDQLFRFSVGNKQNQDTAKTRLTTSISTEPAAIKTTLSETCSDANLETNNFSSLDRTPNDTSSINNKITTAL